MAIVPLEDEAEVLARVAIGDERAFARLFLWYSDSLANFVQRLTHSLDLTEEIIQDVFITVWKRKETVREIGTFHNYLFILCRNLTYARMKSVAAERVKQITMEHHHRVFTEWDQLENPSEQYRQQIEQIVNTLPSQQREAYSLSRYERLKHEEIAVKMGISAETVKKHIQAAVKTIQRRIAGMNDAGLLAVLALGLMQF